MLKKYYHKYNFTPSPALLLCTLELQLLQVVYVGHGNTKGGDLEVMNDPHTHTDTHTEIVNSWPMARNIIQAVFFLLTLDKKGAERGLFQGPADQTCFPV